MGSCLLIVGVVAFVLIPGKAVSYTDIVQTSSGPVRGEEVKYGGTTYKSFKGIPYAAAPVGAMRFKDPQLPASWTEVRNATSYGKICYQPGLTSSPNTSEDCLTLNVYTPSLSHNARKPVLFTIHGGGFFAGENTDGVFGPQHLMEHDLVVVVITYRLGPIGYLATNTSDATGNWGMKDQVAALQWVQRNIRHFGGNPEDVTIYGASAGGVSVHLHLFSPLSKGLFHKAIVASGSVLNPWPFNSYDQQERYSRKLARLLGALDADIEDPAKRVEFLRRADPKAITDRMFDVRDEKDDKNPMFLPVPFTPVVESANTRGAFLTEDPRKMLHEGRFTKVPIMMGMNDLEGDLAYMGFAKNFTPERMRETEQNVCQVLPDPLRDEVMAKNGCHEVAQLMRDAYFEGKHFDSSLLKFVYLYGDLFITKDVLWSQRLHARYSNNSFPLYNYYFTFDGRWNIFKKLNNISFPGAGHGDETFYIFKSSRFEVPDLPASSKEVVTKDRYTSFIANFVKYGNPTPTVTDLIPIHWMPAKENEPTTMIIGDDLKLDKELLKDRFSMWHKIYKKYGKASI